MLNIYRLLLNHLTDFRVSLGTTVGSYSNDVGLMKKQQI